MGPSRADTAAAEEALKLAIQRLERASAGVARSGGRLARTNAAWERAWREYLLAMVVALTIIPHRLTRDQRWLARWARSEWEAERRARPRAGGAS